MNISAIDRLVTGYSTANLSHPLSAIYRCDEGYRLDALYSGSMKALTDYEFHIGVAAADVQLLLSDVAVLTSRSTGVSSALKFDLDTCEISSFNDKPSTDLDCSSFTVGLFKVTSHILLQVTSKCLFFLDSKTLRLMKRVTREELKISGRILFSCVETLSLQLSELSEMCVIGLVESADLHVMLIPISSLSGKGLSKPLSYTVISKRQKQDICAISCTKVVGDVLGLSSGPVQHANYILALGLWEVNVVKVLSLNRDGHDIITLHEVHAPIDINITGIRFSHYSLPAIGGREDFPLFALWYYTGDTIGIRNYYGSPSKSDGVINLKYHTNDSIDIDKDIKFSSMDFSDGVILNAEAIIPQNLRIDPSRLPTCGFAGLFAWTGGCGYYFHVVCDLSRSTSETRCEITCHRLLNQTPCFCPVVVYDGFAAVSAHSRDLSLLEMILTNISIIWIEKDAFSAHPEGVVRVNRVKPNINKKRVSVSSFSHIAGSIVRLQVSKNAKRYGRKIEHLICEYIPHGCSIIEGVSMKLYNARDLSCLISFNNRDICRLENGVTASMVNYSEPIGALCLFPASASKSMWKRSGASFAMCFRRADGTYQTDSDPERHCHASIVVYDLIEADEENLRFQPIGICDNIKISMHSKLSRELKPTEIALVSLQESMFFACASYGRITMLKRNKAISKESKSMLFVACSSPVSPQVSICVVVLVLVTIFSCMTKKNKHNNTAIL